MRCKCCDSKETVHYTLKDWYCAKCREEINKTILEDRMVYDKKAGET